MAIITVEAEHDRASRGTGNHKCSSSCIPNLGRVLPGVREAGTRPDTGRDRERKAANSSGGLAAISGALDKFAAPASPEILGFVHEFMSFLDPEGKMGIPKIEIVNRSSVTWLGVCNWQAMGGPSGLIESINSLIQIQKGTMVNPRTLRRVVAHEVVHHVVAWELLVGKPVGDANAVWKNEGDHGKYFFEVAERVNAKEGAGFITKTSDESDVYERKKVFLFVMVQASGKINWCWSPSVPAGVVDLMAALNGLGNGTKAFIGTTTSPALVVKGAKAPTWAGTQDPTALDILEQTMQSQINLFPEYASGVKPTTQPPEKRWTLVMANPKRVHPNEIAPEPAWINAWAIARPLQPKELDALGGNVGRWSRFKVTKVVGEKALFNTLPKFDLHSAMDRSGLPGNLHVNSPEVQEPLRKYWNQSDPVEAKVAHVTGIIVERESFHDGTREEDRQADRGISGTQDPSCLGEQCGRINQRRIEASRRVYSDGRSTGRSEKTIAWRNTSLRQILIGFKDSQRKCNYFLWDSTSRTLVVVRIQKDSGGNHYLAFWASLHWEKPTTWVVRERPEEPSTREIPRGLRSIAGFLGIKSKLFQRSGIIVERESSHEPGRKTQDRQTSSGSRADKNSTNGPGIPGDGGAPSSARRGSRQTSSGVVLPSNPSVIGTEAEAKVALAAIGYRHGSSGSSTSKPTYGGLHG